jgi:hypothetical protein
MGESHISIARRSPEAPRGVQIPAPIGAMGERQDPGGNACRRAAGWAVWIIC